MILHALFAVSLVAQQANCNQPDHEVEVVQAAPTEYPDSARDLGLGPVEVLVAVTIDANGSVVNATISHSSSNGAIDRMAVIAARKSTFEPKLVNCVATQGTYLLHAQFNPGSMGPAFGGIPQYQSAPTCPNAYREASVVNQAAPDPDLARRENVYSVVLLQVTIGPLGEVLSATIYKSSDNAAVDRAAIVAARQSTYAPKLDNCFPVKGDYLFRILFKPN